jgi:hypothetical protein
MRLCWRRRRVRRLIWGFSMDKVERYREYVEGLVIGYGRSDMTPEGVAVELVLDVLHDHYQWMNVGWDELRWVYQCFVHIDIREGKVWIQQNWTEVDLAEVLVGLGVLREDIVLGYLPPYKRPYSGYGIG